MDEHSYRQAQWLISERDFRVHAFYHVAEPQGFLEALCEHTVPPELIVRPDDTTLTAPKCQKCLITYGEDIASEVQRWME